MSELEIFLNCLAKTTYPSDKTLSVAKICGYEIGNFLKDLHSEFGEEKAKEFVNKTFSKILRNNMLCYDLTEYPSGGNVCVEIKKMKIDFENNIIYLTVVWGPTKILDEKGNPRTIDDLLDDADMSEWSNVEDFIDSILRDIEGIIFEDTGFQAEIQ